MSADILRQAASLMRERAEAATPGPWTLYHDGISGPGLEDEVTGPDCGCGGGILNEDTEAFIASWHPAVALAAADWLDDIAGDYESWSKSLRGQASIIPPKFSRPFNLARAYLGGER